MLWAHRMLVITIIYSFLHHYAANKGTTWNNLNILHCQQPPCVFLCRAPCLGYHPPVPRVKPQVCFLSVFGAGKAFPHRPFGMELISLGYFLSTLHRNLFLSSPLKEGVPFSTSGGHLTQVHPIRYQVVDTCYPYGARAIFVYLFF